jgi:hypothetical protein
MSTGSRKMFLETGARPVRRTDNLTAIRLSRQFGIPNISTLWASTACYKDSFLTSTVKIGYLSVFIFVPVCCPTKLLYACLVSRNGAETTQRRMLRCILNYVDEKRVYPNLIYCSTVYLKLLRKSEQQNFSCNRNPDKKDVRDCRTWFRRTVGPSVTFRGTSRAISRRITSISPLLPTRCRYAFVSGSDPHYSLKELPLAQLT